MQQKKIHNICANYSSKESDQTAAGAHIYPHLARQAAVFSLSAEPASDGASTIWSAESAEWPPKSEGVGVATFENRKTSLFSQLATVTMPAEVFVDPYLWLLMKSLQLAVKKRKHYWAFPAHKCLKRGMSCEQHVPLAGKTSGGRIVMSLYVRLQREQQRFLRLWFSCSVARSAEFSGALSSPPRNSWLMSSSFEESAAISNPTDLMSGWDAECGDCRPSCTSGNSERSCSSEYHSSDEEEWWLVRRLDSRVVRCFGSGSSVMLPVNPCRRRRLRSTAWVAWTHCGERVSVFVSLGSSERTLRALDVGSCRKTGELELVRLRRTWESCSSITSAPSLGKHALPEFR